MVQGTRITMPQWIEGRLPGGGGSFVVRIEVEAVVPDADPSEPCFEPETAKMLDEAQRLADAGDLDALAELGDIYIRRTA